MTDKMPEGLYSSEEEKNFVTNMEKIFLGALSFNQPLKDLNITTAFSAQKPY